MRRRFNRYSRRKVEAYPSEAEMCEVLRAATLAEGWAPYPETGGWDLLLVRPLDGLQVGVQAKLLPNVDVLSQTLVGDREKGPDVHAVLVPTCSEAFREVARALRVLVLEAGNLDAARLPTWKRLAKLPELVEVAPRRVHLPGRCWLPPFIPTLPAGTPGPQQVTPWKVGASKLCATLRTRGGEGVTTAEIRALELAPSTWQRRWLERVPGTAPARWVPLAGVRLPDVEFPWVAAGLGLPEPL